MMMVVHMDIVNMVVVSMRIRMMVTVVMGVVPEVVTFNVAAFLSVPRLVQESVFSAANGVCLNIMSHIVHLKNGITIIPYSTIAVEESFVRISFYFALSSIIFPFARTASDFRNNIPNWSYWE